MYYSIKVLKWSLWLYHVLGGKVLKTSYHDIYYL